MGVAISGWRLARAVAALGQLGVVSGTAIDNVFIRRLQDNGVDDELSGVLASFPDQKVVEAILARFAQAQRDPDASYLTIPMMTARSPQFSQDLLTLATFAEVALAKLGHDGPVGINLLTKIQMPTAPTLFGAILAGVDYVCMGAGVPFHIPGALDRLAQGLDVEMPLAVAGGEPISLHFDPSRYELPYALTRPKFLGIVASNTLAAALTKRSNGTVEGFIVERPSAGGHNAPPRGDLVTTDDGEPVYGPRDEVDFSAMNDLRLPYWIGGGVTSPAKVREALALGATGVQVGTLFAFCDESGMDPQLRSEVVASVRDHPLAVKTSMRVSSTGYPFKVADVPGTIADPALYAKRRRKCDLGYLRNAYLKVDGSLGYRCAAEPVKDFVRKGGTEEETTDVACLCNGLLATAGFPQRRSDGHNEYPIVTSGDALNEIKNVAAGLPNYQARDVIAYLDPELNAL
jgi:nitronate monooxygenase